MSAKQQELEFEKPKTHEWRVHCAVRYERIYWMPPRHFDTEPEAKRYARESLRVGIRDVAYKIEQVDLEAERREQGL